MRRSPAELRPINPETLNLSELRRALRVTQTELARRLNKGQEVVSRIEQRQDMRLSTLRDYVSSLGGELELVCRFGNRAAVRLRTGKAGEGIPTSAKSGKSAALPGAPTATEIAMAVSAPFAQRGDREGTER